MTAFQEGRRHVAEFNPGMTFVQCAALSTNGRSRNFDQTAT
jgi:hypothetical protein